MKLIEGWKAIADAIGKSRSQTIRYAKRSWDPLPAYRRFGTIVVSETALRDWERRQTVACSATQAG